MRPFYKDLGNNNPTLTAHQALGIVHELRYQFWAVPPPPPRRQVTHPLAKQKFHVYPASI